VLAGLILLFVIAGLVYQFVATRLAYRAYPAPGQMVAVSGHGMQLYCAGKAREGPTVVMDSGLGGGLLDWQTVQPKVAKFVRVCSYDRSGLGWSESGPKPHTSPQIVEELHTLLENAGVGCPYVLVGHSFGGANAQLYAAEYPKEVAGIVLVDSTPDLRVFDKDLRDAAAPSAPSPLMLKVVVALGIDRLSPEPPGSPNPPEGLEDERNALYSSTGHLYAALDESVTFNESVAEVANAAPSLGEKPLIVLSAGARQYPGFTKGQIKRFDEQFNKFEAGLTDLSENSKLVVAKDSAHYIQFDRPELVVDAIRRVVDTARDSGRV